MRISPIVLLVFAMLGCGSGTEPTGEDQAQQQKVATPEKQASSPKPPKVVPNSPEAKAAIEAAIREAADKPTGELTKADLEKVTRFVLSFNQITDLKPLAGLTELEELLLDNNQITDLTPLAELTKLEWLWLSNNPNLTNAEIGKLQKALNCRITHNATK